MARLPSSILKQLTARAKELNERMLSIDGSSPEDHILLEAHESTNNCYLMYDDAIRAFIIAGYSEPAAEKYINFWKDYGLTDVWYLHTYKIIGFNIQEIEKAMQ